MDQSHITKDYLGRIIEETVEDENGTILEEIRYDPETGAVSEEVQWR
jgi:hypothetical protein